MYSAIVGVYCASDSWCILGLNLYFVYKFLLIFIAQMFKYVLNVFVCFPVRWTTLGWPRKIQEQSENCTKQLEQDEERFQKNLSNDQATFEDRLDSLEV